MDEEMASIIYGVAQRVLRRQRAVHDQNLVNAPFPKHQIGVDSRFVAMIALSADKFVRTKISDVSRLWG